MPSVNTISKFCQAAPKVYPFLSLLDAMLSQRGDPRERQAYPTP